MTEEERQAHMEQDAKRMKDFMVGVVLKILLFLIVVALGVAALMYNK